MNNEIIADLGLQSIKKYWKCATQIADKLSHFQDFLPIRAVFLNEVCIDYDQKMHLDKHLRFRQERDYK